MIVISASVGSDLKEVCRCAAMVPVQEFIKEQAISRHDSIEFDEVRLRPLCASDFYPKIQEYREGKAIEMELDSLTMP